MIKVSVRSNDEYYSYLCVKGHANSAEYGNDLICSAVSSIVFGLLNAIDMVNDLVTINVFENKIEIINDSQDQKVNDYIELAIIQLRTIEDSYSQYINIDERRK